MGRVARRTSIISLCGGKNGMRTTRDKQAWVSGLGPGTLVLSPARRRPGRAWRRVTVLQRVIGIIVAIGIIVWIVSNPAAAGDTVHSWITGIVTFFHHLA